MAWVEKDHNDHPVSTPLLSAGSQPPDQAALSREVFVFKVLIFKFLHHEEPSVRHGCRLLPRGNGSGPRLGGKQPGRDDQQPSRRLPCPTPKMAAALAQRLPAPRMLTPPYPRSRGAAEVARARSAARPTQPPLWRPRASRHPPQGARACRRARAAPTAAAWRSSHPARRGVPRPPPSIHPSASSAGLAGGKR